jgi:hypothetical protein
MAFLIFVVECSLNHLTRKRKSTIASPDLIYNVIHRYVSAPTSAICLQKRCAKHALLSP